MPPVFLSVDGTNVLIGRNTVYRTYADAIHVTGRSRDVKIFQNTVRENGDDMIAVVSYGGINVIESIMSSSKTTMSRVIIGREGLQLSEVRTLRYGEYQYKIHVARGAGILVYSEDPPNGWDYPPVNNVLIENNTIRYVQAAKPVFTGVDTWTRSGMGGIHLDGYAWPHALRGKCDGP